MKTKGAAEKKKKTASGAVHISPPGAARPLSVPRCRPRRIRTTVRYWSQKAAINKRDAPSEPPGRTGSTCLAQPSGFRCPIKVIPHRGGARLSGWFTAFLAGVDGGLTGRYGFDRDEVIVYLLRL